MNIFNDIFYRYGGHIELIRFNEYYGIPRDHKLDPFSRLVLVFMLLHCIFLGKKAIIITSNHGTTMFFPITILSRKTLRKNNPKGT